MKCHACRTNDAILRCLGCEWRGCEACAKEHGFGWVTIFEFLNPQAEAEVTGVTVYRNVEGEDAMFARIGDVSFYGGPKDGEILNPDVLRHFGTTRPPDSIQHPTWGQSLYRYNAARSRFEWVPA